MHDVKRNTSGGDVTGEAPCKSELHNALSAIGNLGSRNQSVLTLRYTPLQSVSGVFERDRDVIMMVFRL
ncbi:hypothetical protein Hypma_009499 [Hypsizygus marmoreus]|uniref:Uncharacterized protein n=1 Tax=Hypsizygus marmoreus TaxID=39966 RepID=A0A369JMN5_HYPMA|nr:hypothetical protein Hypma_009499 [Hypsizygus marmoreus]